MTTATGVTGTSEVEERTEVEGPRSKERGGEDPTGSSPRERVRTISAPPGIRRRVPDQGSHPLGRKDPSTHTHSDPPRGLSDSPVTDETSTHRDPDRGLRGFFPSGPTVSPCLRSLSCRHRSSSTETEFCLVTGHQVVSTQTGTVTPVRTTGARRGRDR